jgi:drug/metabolite transporter (DMT)-like permease
MRAQRFSDKSAFSLLYVFMLFIVVLIWAGSFIFIKVGLREIPPITLALARFALAFPFLLITLFLSENRNKLEIAWKKDFNSFTILALTGVTLLYIFQFYSLKFTTAAAGSIIINTTVIFIALFSAAFLNEKVGFRKVLGIALAFIGIFIVISNGSLNFLAVDPMELVGDALMIAAAVCWAVYSVLSKKILSSYSPLTATTVVFGLGTLYLIPFSLPEFPLDRLANASLLSWLSILYLAVPSSAVAYILWCKALTRMDASKVGVFLYAIPVLTMALSYIFLGETVTYWIILGAALVVCGVYLTQAA